MENKRNRNLDQLRNVGISAHIDAGKTTLSERMLYYCGQIHSMREVHGTDGGATMDSSPIEKRRGITIASAATTVDWTGHHINIIDTPGHVDFTVEVERSLRVLDGAVLVLCAVGGVQSQTVTVDRQMRRYGTPRIALINKMDRIGANYKRVVEQLVERLNANPILLQIPIGSGESFVGVVDLISMRAVFFDGEDGADVRLADIPIELVSEAMSARCEMLERLSVLDERLFETLCEGEEPAIESIQEIVRSQTIARSITPVLLASAFKNVAVQCVLDAICDYLPSPQERLIHAEQVDNDRTVALSADANGQTVLMAFKTVIEKFGQLTYLRLYQGKLERGWKLKNVRTGDAVRFGRLLRVHSDKRQEIEAAEAGDIIAVIGVDCASGDTFVSDGPDLLLENIVVAPPVVRLVIEAERREDTDKLAKLLDQFRREDPTFHVLTDLETGETQIAGIGKLQLDVYLERLSDELGCPCHVGDPCVTYRERPTKSVAFKHRLKKQNGGQGMFAEIAGRMEPLEQSSVEDFVFESQITGGRLPASFVSAVQSSMRETFTSGPIKGHPMIGVKITLTDGMVHEKDSSEMSFRRCADEVVRQI
ncbi:MAG: elongation factor G, partial [Planctomycetota bacterium]